MTTSLVAEGFLFGVDQTQLAEQFDPAHPYTYCRICGWMYQPAFQRKIVAPHLTLVNAPNDSEQKREKRRTAAITHSRQHTQAEKDQVGEFDVTPEAQFRLAAFGIANLTSIATNPDVKQAGEEAPRPGIWTPDSDPRIIHK